MDDSRRKSLRNPQKRLSTATRISIAPNALQYSQSTLHSTLTSSTLRGTTAFDVSGTTNNYNQVSNDSSVNTKYIIKFLSDNKYGQDVTLSSLRILKEADFQAIVHFIVHIIDPNIRMDHDIKNDFPMVMSMLGYQKKFNNSDMQSLSTPFKRGQFITAIRWLVQIAEYILDLRKVKNQQDEEKDDLLFTSIQQAYCFFMDNDDDSEKTVLSEIHDSMTSRNQVIEEELTRLQQHRQDIEDEVKVLNNVNNDLYELQKRGKDLESDKVKFEAIITSKQNHLASEVSKKEKLIERQHDIEEKLNELKKKNDSLKEQVNKQEYSPEQIQQLKNNAEEWKQRVNSIMNQIDEVNERIKIAITSIDQKASNIDELINSYHSLLLSLHLLPSNSELANGIDYQLKLEHVDDVTSVSTRNVQQYERLILNNTILGKLNGVIEEYQKSVDKAILGLREEIVKFDDKKQKKESELEQLTVYTTSLKERCDCLQKQRDSLLCQVSASQTDQGTEVDKLKIDNATIKVKIESKQNEIELLKKQQEEMEKEKDDILKSLVNKERQEQELVISLLDSISKYKETADSELQRFHNFCVATQNE